VPAPVLALGVTAMAVMCFIGAEKLEAHLRRTRKTGTPILPARPRRLAFAGLFAAAALGVGLLALPAAPRAAAAPRTPTIVDAPGLAARVLAEPWRLRIVDLRDQAACLAARVPGSECVPLAGLDKLGLADDRSGRDLVLVGAEHLDLVPGGAAAYPGEILALAGGFPAWADYALTAPTLSPTATPAEREAYKVRAAIHSMMTGTKQAPPPPPPSGAPAPRKKAGGGGCSG
jgi:hypothetical protein